MPSVPKERKSFSKPGFLGPNINLFQIDRLPFCEKEETAQPRLPGSSDPVGQGFTAGLEFKHLQECDLPHVRPKRLRAHVACCRCKDRPLSGEGLQHQQWPTSDSWSHYCSLHNSYLPAAPRNLIIPYSSKPAPGEQAVLGNQILHQRTEVSHPQGPAVELSGLRRLIPKGSPACSSITVWPRWAVALRLISILVSV